MENDKRKFEEEANRKPGDWAEVETSEHDYHEMRRALRVFTPHQAFGRIDRTPMGTLKAGVPQMFILRRYDGDYIVDTQGYNYCRYTIRLQPERDPGTSDAEMNGYAARFEGRDLS